MTQQINISSQQMLICRNNQVCLHGIFPYDNIKVMTFKFMTFGLCCLVWLFSFYQTLIIFLQLVLFRMCAWSLEKYALSSSLRLYMIVNERAEYFIVY